MQLDAFLDPGTRLSQMPELARAVDEIGFGTAWLAETQHNPFLAATLLAEHSHKTQIGTAIAVSFARSPAVMAQTAFDLAELSSGRFHLGLGTQVRGHIERRFGMDWPDSPVGKLREQIQAIRAFWALWQDGQALNLRGDYYKLTLSSDFFEPEPIEHPKIPIWIAGVNRGLARLAGEEADGFLVHPFHSVEYLRAHILPVIAKGEKGADNKERTRVMVNVFVITNDEEREFVRQQLSFYASTPSYRTVLTEHGWNEIGEKLSTLAARKRFDEMPTLISDEMLESYAVVAEEEELGEVIEERYGEIADQVTLYSSFRPGERDGFWRNLAQKLNGV